MPASVEIENFIKSCNEYQERLAQCASRALDKFASKILDDARELCPYATGALVESAAKKQLMREGFLFWQEVGFYIGYAAAVHECLLNKVHGKTIEHPHGQAKFLETAMSKNEGKLWDYFEDELEAEFGS